MFLIFPLCFLYGKCIFVFCQFFLQICQTFLTEFVGLFFQRRFLNLHLHDFTLLFIQFCRKRIQLGLDQCAGFIHQVDGFIRQETVGDITVRKCCRCHQGTIRNFYSMIYLIPFFQSTKDGNGIFHGRFIHQYRLETTFQSGIFFDILTVLIQCGCTDTVQFSTGKHRF